MPRNPGQRERFGGRPPGLHGSRPRGRRAQLRNVEHRGLTTEVATARTNELSLTKGQGFSVYGFDELKNEIAIGATTVECPIRGCPRRVARQRKEFLKEERFRCPEHRIVISPSTFEYDREEDNLLCRDATDLALLERIRRVKRESRMVASASSWRYCKKCSGCAAIQTPDRSDLRCGGTGGIMGPVGPSPRG